MPLRKGPSKNGATAGAGPGAGDGASELLRLVLAYAKQETLDPVLAQLKSLVKGVAGALLMAMGTVLLAVGFVRALQFEWGSTGAGGASSAGLRALGGGFVYGSGRPLSGDWSWVPYFGGAAFCLAVAAFCALRILRGARH